MVEISLNNIEKSFGVIQVLKGVTFNIQLGDRAGLIGRNGTGKTTIFKIIAGLESYDSGVLSLRKGSTIGYLEQIPEFSQNATVEEVLKSAFDDLHALKAKMVNLEKQMASIENNGNAFLIRQYGELQNRFEHKGGYDTGVEVEKICSGLKIGPAMRRRRITTLSGGEKTRVMLGRILLENPDVLLLDEPTNHLDIDSVEWLEEFLCQYPGTVLIISHDRYFLDKVVNTIVELEEGQTSLFNGNYSYYLEENDRREMAEFEAYKNQQKKVKAIEEAIKRFRDWGNRTDNPKIWKRLFNMEKRLDRIEKIDRPNTEQQKMGLRFSSTSRSGKDVILVKKLDKSFGDNQVLKDLDFAVYFQERVAIVGKNGTGKSTLLKILLGELQPDKGEIRIGANVRIGSLEQEVSFRDQDKTVLELFREHNVMYEGEARSQLARFLFFGEEVFKRIGDLSGGEKVKLKLCLLMQQDLNLLLLDEPTNHLDIDSREVIEEGLLKFQGTVVFISHDRYFMNKIVHRIAEMRNHRLFDYPGNYNWFRECKEREKAGVPDTPNHSIKKTPGINAAAEGKNEIKKIQRQIANLEKNIDKITREIREQQQDLEKCRSDYKKAIQLHRGICELENKLDEYYRRWGELQSTLETNE
ncbi:ABC-F type ribosomal protection protein [bacterium]|nr:ABC-F type ribosomal protection protein [bacterium]